MRYAAFTSIVAACALAVVVGSAPATAALPESCIHGTAGNDRFVFGVADPPAGSIEVSGTDSVCGGTGNDRLLVGDGARWAGVFYGEDGHDRIILGRGAVADGVFIGSTGADTIAFGESAVMRGRFYGGPGNDRAVDTECPRLVCKEGRYNGQFFGGPGDDDIEFVILGPRGKFIGGPGGDWADEINGGTFFGGKGADSATFLWRGSFFGGAGRDIVNLQMGGLFAGGKGPDILICDDGGRTKGVEQKWPRTRESLC